MKREPAVGVGVAIPAYWVHWETEAVGFVAEVTVQRGMLRDIGEF